MRLISLLLFNFGLLARAFAGLPDLLSEKGIPFVKPGDPEYLNITTPYNRRLTVQPAVVAFPTTATQVADVLKIGSGLNYNVVAQSGGHSYIGNGLGGKNGSIVVDLRSFKDITFDSGNNTARVGTGNRLGDIALALGAHERAIPHGTCPYVGVGGHAAYGGYGFTSRMWGLTLDNVVSIELALANGSLIKASENDHPDLFWALRGAGGSFGITTSIEFATRPVPPSGIVFTYNWVLNVTDAVQALEKFQDFLQSNIPAELGPMLFFFPGAPKGSVLFGLTGGWYGDPQQLNATWDPFLKEMPSPASVILQSGTFIESLQFPGSGAVWNLNTSLAPDTHDTFYVKSIMTPPKKVVSKQAWEGFMTYLANEGNTTSLSWAIEIEVYGGTNSAINSVPLDDTAFAHRDALYTFQLYVRTATGEPPFPQEGFEFAEGLANSIIDKSPPDWDYGAYPNYLDDRLADWQNRYYGTHYRKLQAIKHAVDPSDVFSFPTSIEPLD
ncbi:glucooligosaccharide oxidase [Macrolepiota fuliginosa MF-IS2]|uniref:Glucooligosaccharide oxidase n=1 Tax=Macrolepiota fuliginosa MF-IS2 TaxID=1400762 RepID=A0A9P5X9S7_9AGAR|nr:glucooligosaccharide oxidase [Macrolepiota fuliginosa MF-IS2]